MDLADVLKTVCAHLDAGDANTARELTRREAPFVPPERAKRGYTDRQALAVFRRDGFVDRYSGARLVFPGALRLLSIRMPEDFPFHPNWHTAHTHFAYWSLSATLDHVVPVARGGEDAEPNWVTTSQLRNSAKAHWSLEELGWRLHPPGRLEDWDGLFGWFLRHLRSDASLARHPALQRWRRAAEAADRT